MKANFGITMSKPITSSKVTGIAMPQMPEWQFDHTRPLIYLEAIQFIVRQKKQFFSESKYCLHGLSHICGQS